MTTSRPPVKHIWNFYFPAAASSATRGVAPPSSRRRSPAGERPNRSTGGKPSRPPGRAAASEARLHIVLAALQLAHKTARYILLRGRSSLH
jgi:hypothetical protein